MWPKRVTKQSLEVVKPATLRVETKCQTQWGDICLCREKCKTVQGMLRSLSSSVRHRGIQSFPGFLWPAVQMCSITQFLNEQKMQLRLFYI